MRNVRTIHYGVCETAAEITSACWDAGKDEVLVTFGPTAQSSQIELARVAEGTSTALQYEVVASWDAPSPNPGLAADKIVSSHHFGDTLTTCLVLAGGDIVVVQEEDGVGSTADGVHIEIVGSIDAGITAARWSPDEELLVITTKADTVVLMSRGFDGIADVAMSVGDLKASKHVSVGWGKRETQFEGRGAKALIDPTIPRKVDQGLPSPQEDGRTTIGWRGDGAYVAINSIVGDARRAIRVYTREGVLDSVSEPVDGLEGSLSWRPSGNLIAGIQRFSDHSDVVFFERNGLKHGQFTLRAPDTVDISTDRIGLEWNVDSTVLAVIYPTTVQLWTMGNYHWYLKQEMPTGPGCSQLVFHPEKALRFTTTALDRLLCHECVFTTARGSLAPPDDHGAVAVVDGKTIKVTPFRTANVPPPMAMFELEAPASVIDVAFSPTNSAMAVLHHKGVEVYAWQTKGSRSLVPSLQSSVLFERSQNAPYEHPAFAVSFSSEDEFQLLEVNEGDLTVTAYATKSSGGAYERVGSQTCASGTTISPILDAGTRGSFTQERSGRLFRIARDTKEPISARFPTQLPWAEAVAYDGELIALGLSRNGHLYANSRTLAKNCTSFLVTSKHIIMTTNNHLLKFIHLTGVDDLEVPPDDPENDERCRSIERGARLVTAMPTNMNLVLQMPRGNLETIYPRAMVVAGIRQLIDEKDYSRAFSFCRTQRVDMNLLYDHRPQQFLSNVGLFLDQLKDLTSIDLFLSSLKEENVTQTMYRDTRPGKDQLMSSLPAEPSESSAPTDSAKKINTICDAVLQGLRTRKNANLQNIISAHVCKSPPALDDGLLVVADLMREDESLAEKAVEHICFLVDVNKLYDHALGLYNLDLALLVAQQSQRDPREYLPFIQNLHQMSELRRRFAIDDHLDHNEKALGHLRALDVFEEVQDYAVKHDLYQTALRLYRYEQERHRTLTGLYAAFLESKSKFREAGLAYESLGNNAKATGCYRAAGAACWRECLFAAQQQQDPPLSEPALAELASALADALWEAKDYASAAVIHAEHLASPEAAIRCLCKGYLFADAMRLAARQHPAARCRELLDGAVDAGLADALSSTTELLADCKAQLRAQVPRIAELRRKAAEDPLAFYEGERPGGGGGGGGDDDDDMIPDNVSVAASSRLSTSASLFTRYTGKAGSTGTAGTGVSRATSKNRRREEKKRARGRKGTVYEEEYLANSVRRLVERVEGARGDMERLVFALARRGMAERARAVEALMGEVGEGCRAAIGEVWPADGGGREGGPAVVSGAEGETMECRRPTGGDAVLQESLDARRARQEPPVISDVARLSLLG